MAESNNPKWTDEQQAAIDHRSGAAVVSAGAGSGKTAVLSQRVISMICDNNNPVDPSKLAVVTFTEKAATELKVRLARLLKERIASEPQNAAFLRAQSVKLHNAKISTISSFCFSLIRENIELTDFAAGFSVIDQTRSDIMKRAVADALLEEFYKTASDEDKKTALENFSARDDRTLGGLIITASEFTSNITDIDDWFDRCLSADFSQSVKKGLYISAERQYEQLQVCFEELKDNIESLLCELDGKKHKACGEFLDSLKNNLTAAAELMKENGYKFDSNVAMLEELIPKKPPITDAELKADFTAVKDCFSELKAVCTKIADFEKEMSFSQPVVSLLARLVRKFIAMYSEEKHAQNVADFADAERGVYDMLKNHPQAAKKIGLQLIIVDEFQDSNRLQYEIFSMLSDNMKNLYLVGDIKQSIYSFRGAQPEVFSQTVHGGQFKVYPLDKNFRSKACVIDGINAIFDRIMTKELGGVDYSTEGRLICGRNDVPAPCDITEVCVVAPEEGEVGAEVEAQYIADRISAMIKGGYQVFGRPCCEDDFAIIMRSPKSKTQIYASALESRNLRVCAPDTGSFCEQPEIALMLDYLKVIDNPYNDECLARLLMSVIFGFSADKMARVRTGTCGFDIPELTEICGEELKRYTADCQRLPLYACVTSAARGYHIDSERYPILSRNAGGIPDEECGAFISELDRLRNIMASSSPQQLIRTIYDTTPAANLLTLSENPSQRTANLNLLIKYAQEYSGINGGGILSDFFDSLELISETGRQLSSAQSTEQSAGVKIMSIHASKGLQFPILFVADCAKTFNTDDVRKDVILSEAYGICAKAADKRLMSKVPSPAYEYAADELTRKQRSEEMRLLYVAATRAEEKLIFTGYRKKGLDDVFDEIKSPSDTGFCSKSSYLAWLLDAAATYDNKENDGGVYVGDSLKYTEIRQIAPQGEEATAIPAKEAGECDENPDTDAQHRITRGYQHDTLTRMAAKYTATELVRNRRIIAGSSEYCDLYISMPAFMRDNEKALTGKRRGDAYHKVMEHIPFDRAYDEQEIDSYLLDCTADYLTDAERSCIKPADIAAFFATDVAQRMIKSENVYREHPIFHKLDVSKLTAAELGLSQDDDYSDAEPYMQGIADMFFIEDGKIILVDYKSDSFSDEEHLLNDYAFQLKLYKEALIAEFDMPVSEMYIYSFRLKKMIDAGKEQ